SNAREPEDLGRGGNPGRARVAVIVVDASALLAFLPADRAWVCESRPLLFRDGDQLHTPHLVWTSRYRRAFDVPTIWRCYFASGSGRTWNFTTFGRAPLPPS